MFTESAEFYDAIYSFKNYADEAGRIAALIRTRRPHARSILDVGCGTGEHARILAMDPGFEVDGLDLDPRLLEAARAKHPSGRFVQADMSDFAAGRTYDVVLCLFSSIGYLVTLDRTKRALMCFRDHLELGGLVVVEPWFPPGAMTDGHVFRHTGTHQGMDVERVSRTEILGRVSRLHFEYRVQTPTGARQLTEVHELGLFTSDEMRATFEAVGLVAEFDPVGLTGRGLWIASRSDIEPPSRNTQEVQHVSDGIPILPGARARR